MLLLFAYKITDFTVDLFGVVGRIIVEILTKF